MNYRPLGRTGPPLCLGAMNFGGPTPENESITLLDRALDGGINFIDTANVYKPTKANELSARRWPPTDLL